MIETPSIGIGVISVLGQQHVNETPSTNPDPECLTVQSVYAAEPAHQDIRLNTSHHGSQGAIPTHADSTHSAQVKM